MKKYLLFMLSILSPVDSSAASPRRCEIKVTCRGQECGCDLLKEGWKMIAECDGHQWNYIIEKSKTRKLCTGIDALGGSEEYPCTSFSGDLKEFKRCKKLELGSPQAK